MEFLTKEFLTKEFPTKPQDINVISNTSNSLFLSMELFQLLSDLGKYSGQHLYLNTEAYGGKQAVELIWAAATLKAWKFFGSVFMCGACMSRGWFRGQSGESVI